MNRRHWLAAISSLTACSMTACSALLAARTASACQERSPYRFAAFVKFLQSLSNRQLAESIRDLGFDGIEATVRRGGQVAPEKVEEQLPPLVQSLQEAGLTIEVMASDVQRADDPLTQRVLETASKLGVRRYRMKYFRYERGRSLSAQLQALKPVVRDLAAMNKQLGMQAVYQNHSGPNYVGAPVWDLAELLQEIDPQQVAVAFDIRHATAEGGQSWPLSFRRVADHLGAIYVKDFVWDVKRRRPRNVPLGEGLVDPSFFKLLKTAHNRRVPISLHVEYLGDQDAAANLKAIQRDFATLQELLHD